MMELCFSVTEVSLGMEPGWAGYAKLSEQAITCHIAASRKGGTGTGSWHLGQTRSIDAPRENSEDLHGDLWWEEGRWRDGRCAEKGTCMHIRTQTHKHSNTHACSPTPTHECACLLDCARQACTHTCTHTAS